MCTGLLVPFVPSDLGAGHREHRGRPLAELADWLCWQLSKFTKGLFDTYLQWQGTEPDLGAAVWEKNLLSELKTRKKKISTLPPKQKQTPNWSYSKEKRALEENLPGILAVSWASPYRDVTLGVLSHHQEAIGWVVMENRIKERQKCSVCCPTRNTFYPLEWEMLNQHLEKCSRTNKKQLPATVAPSEVQYRNFGSCTQTRREKRSPVSCWVSYTQVI